MATPCLVTGATGFIGKPLVRELLKNGREVHAIVRSEEKYQELLTFLRKSKVPISHLHAHIAEFTGTEFSPTIQQLIPHMMEVYHFGADVSMVSTPENTRMVNFESSRAILEECWKAWKKSPHRKLVMASTVAVYGVAEEPLREGAPFRQYMGSNPYAASKQRMEKRVAHYAKKGLNVVTIRPSGVYGLNAPYIFPELARFSIRGRLSNLSEKGLDVSHNLCHVEDVVRATLFVAEKPTNPGESFNVAEPRAVTWRELLETYFSHQKEKFKPEKGTRSIRELSRLPRLQGYLTEPHRYSTDKLLTMGFRYRHSFKRGFPRTLPGIFKAVKKNAHKAKLRKNLRPGYRPRK